MKLEIGQKVGDYEVTGVIGSGGMGSVYKVRNVISDRLEAMKVLLADLNAEGERAERFLNEIKVLASLNHPNIAALHTAFRLDNRLLMVMELVDGITLSQRLRRGPLRVPDAIACIVQVLAALAYAHGKGVIHRDIKPANIAIDRQGVVKLLDFGLARGRSNLSLTRTGAVLGSLYYMSPEQVKGLAADARSDIYSVGVTLYRILTGQRPINGENEFEVMRAQVNDIPRPPRDHDPTLPQGLSDAILRALAKDPKKRFQTADEFRRAVAPFLTGGQERAPSSLSEEITRAVSSEEPHTPSSGSIHAAALSVLEKNLTRWMGPIAGAVVRRQSKSAVSLSELCRRLAEQIPAEADRRLFLKACASELGPEAMHDSGSTAARAARTIAWDPLFLERTRRTLAQFIGPVAKVVVERAAGKAHDEDELYAILSAEITSEADRRKFQAARAKSAN